MWTKLHLMTLLPCCAIYIIIAYVLSVILKNKSEKVKLIPSKIIAVLLIVFEITKQILAIKNGYSKWTLPLHFCSQFFWLIPLMAFYNGKYKYTVREISTTASAMLFLFMCIYPSSVYGDTAILSFFTNFSCFHSVFYHNLVLLNLAIVLACRLNEFDTNQDIQSNIMIFGLYSIIAGYFAQVLRTNFNNFYYNFVPLFENIRLGLISSFSNFGQLLYVVIVAEALIVGSVLAYGFVRLIDLALQKHSKT